MVEKSSKLLKQQQFNRTRNLHLLKRIKKEKGMYFMGEKDLHHYVEQFLCKNKDFISITWRNDKKLDYKLLIFDHFQR